MFPYVHLLLLLLCFHGDGKQASENPFKLQLKAWMGGSPADAPSTQPSLAKKKSGMSLKVRVSNQERRVSYIEKDKSLEEISPKMEPEQREYEVVQLRPPEKGEVTHYDPDLKSEAAADDVEEMISAEILDDTGRIGPMFEVRDTMIFRPPPPLPTKNILHARFDT
ncbi:unnamed protein product, partial [Cylicostephanus goldi]